MQLAWLCHCLSGSCAFPNCHRRGASLTFAFVFKCVRMHATCTCNNKVAHTPMLFCNHPDVHTCMMALNYFVSFILLALSVHASPRRAPTFRLTLVRSRRCRPLHRGVPLAWLRIRTCRLADMLCLQTTGWLIWCVLHANSCIAA